MPAAPHSDLIDEAVALARRWVLQAAEVEQDPAAERLAGVLRDPNGLDFTVGFVDGVIRPESLTAAARNLARIAPLAPGFLPLSLRAAVRAGGAVGLIAPAAVIPLARRVLAQQPGLVLGPFQHVRVVKIAHHAPPGSSR